MPRVCQQDVNGYKVAISHLQKEYTRALNNTARPPAIYQGFLDRIQWCLDRCQREQRELAKKSRSASTRSSDTKRSTKKKARRGDS